MKQYTKGQAVFWGVNPLPVCDHSDSEKTTKAGLDDQLPPRGMTELDLQAGRAGWMERGKTASCSGNSMHKGTMVALGF